LAKKANEVIQYFENLYASGAIYLWGANGQIITKALCDDLYKKYGNTTYNREYYDKKLIEGTGKIGADCSGSMYPMSGFDTTAQDYYNKCLIKGGINLIDKNKPCLVFKGKTTSSIHHIGFYCGNGYTIEMESSAKNCTKKLLEKGEWNYFGIPSWIDYSITASPVLGVDLSSNQGEVNFKSLKDAGYQFVILRTILKSGKVDTYYNRYLSEAKKYGFKIGVYIFSYDTTEMQAITSAQKVVNLLNGAKYPIFLDLEWATQRALGNTMVQKIAQAFIQTCNQYGYKSYIYCNLDWYKNVITSPIKPYAVWIARYGNKPNVGEKIWQYSSKGRVLGVSGYVDVNECYDMSIFDSVSNDVTPQPTVVTTQPINILGVITASSLRIRQEPNSSSEILGSYKNKEIVSLIGKTSNNWYKTNLGYISGEYVKYLQGQIVNCNKVNVRQLPDKTAISLAVIPAKTTVFIIAGLNDWYNVLLPNNTIGWIKKDYISLQL